jgi:hypothetical protein
MDRSISLLLVSAAVGYSQSKPWFVETFESGKIDPAVWDTRVAGFDAAA